MKVTKDSLIGDVVEKHPKAVEVLLKYGLHCIGCHVAASESIENGCLAHGMSKDKIKKLVEDINKKID